MLKKKKIRVLLAIIIIGILIFGLMKINGIYQTKRFAKMNSAQLIEEYCKDKENVVLTVGIIQNGKIEYKVYGENGEELPNKEYSYEIGSITKTFTASLLCKAIAEGKVNLDDSISEYIELEEGQYYPTIKKLATHTSGYGIYPLSSWLKEVKCYFGSTENPGSDYKLSDLEKAIQNKILSDKEYKFKYSNFGFSVLGDIICKVYEKDYQTLMDEYIEKDLGLSNTYVGLEKTDLNGYNQFGKIANWSWGTGDAYLPEGSLVSSVTDLLTYAQIQMLDEKGYLSLSQEKNVEISDGYNIGLAWFVMDDNIVFHSGGTGGFDTFIAFDKERDFGVVVLSNYQYESYNNSSTIGSTVIKEIIENY